MLRHTMVVAGIWCVAGSAAFDTGSYLMQMETAYAGGNPPTLKPTPAPTGSGATPAPTLAGVPCDCYSCWDDEQLDIDGNGFFTLSECNNKIALNHLSVLVDNCTYWLTSQWDLNGDGQLNKTEFKALFVANPTVCKPEDPRIVCYPECCTPGHYWDCYASPPGCVPCFGGVTPITYETDPRTHSSIPVRRTCVKDENNCKPPLVDIGDFDECASLEEGFLADDVLQQGVFTGQRRAGTLEGSCEIPLSRAPGEANLHIKDIITLTRRVDQKHVCPGLCPNETHIDQESMEIIAIDTEEAVCDGVPCHMMTVSPCPCGSYRRGDEVVLQCKWTDGTNPNPATEYSQKRDENGDKISVCQCGMQQCKPHQMCYCPPEVTFPYSTQTCGNYSQRYVELPCCECINITTWPPIPTPGPSVGAKGDPHLVNLQGEHFDINHAGEFTLLRIPQDVEQTAEIQLTATVTSEYGKPCTTYITQAEVSGSWLGNTSVQLRCYRKFHPDMVDGAFLGARVLGKARGEVPWSGIEAFLSDERALALSDPARAGETEVTLSKSQWFPKRKAAGAVPAVAGMFTFSLRNTKSLAEARLVVRQDLPDQEHLNLVVQKLSALGRVDVGGLLGFDEHPQKLEQISPECYEHRTKHRVESQEDSAYSYKPAWKERWDKIRAQKHNQAKADPDAPVEDDAAASLMGDGHENERSMVCKCPGGGDEGVMVEEMTALFAEASWD